MLLFKPYHIRLILNGQKTQTRRIWKKCRCRVGSVHLAKTQMLSKEYFAKLLITRVWRDWVGNISREDARKEGGYTLKGFKDIWKEINGHYDPDEVVWAIEFEVEK